MGRVKKQFGDSSDPVFDKPILISHIHNRLFLRMDLAVAHGPGEPVAAIRERPKTDESAYMRERRGKSGRDYKDNHLLHRYINMMSKSSVLCRVL